ncbi:hypothetical protein [Lacibacter sp.]|uniref:hypothetical protein n=1 Tax=Lacibacter sp. TaxID=1915409 RepID=UPI002B4AF27F|nr:hypothetical protein [Lacibacter sp.]HLP38087.1 hypothetical protein [Lacibacter sp.]
MRNILFTGLLITILSLSSCSMIFWAYVRNISNDTALIDVYLLDKSDWRTLPNQIKTAHEAVSFKAGYTKRFDSYTNVTWVDTAHFKVMLPPNTTLDLNDLAGMFYNGGSTKDILVVITTQSRLDTLLKGRYEFLKEPHLFKTVGTFKPFFYKPVLVYDVR